MIITPIQLILFSIVFQMTLEYPVYHYNNWKKAGGIIVIAFTLVPAILIILGRLLLIKMGYHEDAIDGLLKYASPVMIIFYIII